eukprot:2201924-Prymnesium_polylepis.2
MSNSTRLHSPPAGNAPVRSQVHVKHLGRRRSWWVGMRTASLGTGTGWGVAVGATVWPWGV